MMRVGIGYDVHPLAEGRPLILGGVTVDYERGLLGHSDADVLLHAVIDALLGAAAVKDIGTHFPDNDSRYKDISSIRLLKRVGDMLHDDGFKVINVDATILCEKPRLAEYTNEMRRNIGDTLNIETGNVSVKATTTEGLGFVGRGEGIAAQAVVLVEQAKKKGGKG